MVLSASSPLYPPFFNSLARLGGTDKEHLRLGHSLKRDFTSCLTVAALSCPSLQIFFLMSLPLPCPSCPSCPSFPLFPSYLPPTLRVFFSVCLVCLILLGLVLSFFFLTSVLFYSRADRLLSRRNWVSLVCWLIFSPSRSFSALGFWAARKQANTPSTNTPSNQTSLF